MVLISIFYQFSFFVDREMLYKEKHIFFTYKTPFSIADLQHIQKFSLQVPHCNPSVSPFALIWQYVVICFRYADDTVQYITRCWRRSFLLHQLRTLPSRKISNMRSKLSQVSSTYSNCSRRISVLYLFSRQIKVQKSMA